MELTVNKKIGYIALIVLGIALIASAILINIYQGETLKSLAGVFIGLGAVLVSLFSARLYMHFKVLKNPEIRRNLKIEANDERNTVIREKAGAKTNSIFTWLLFAVILVFILLDTELYISLALAGLIVVNSALYTFYISYYNKRF